MSTPSFDTNAVVDLPSGGKPALLFLLCHGVGGDAAQMAPVAAALRLKMASPLITAPAPTAALRASVGRRPWLLVPSPETSITRRLVSMALSANLEKAGYPAKRISTTATVKLEMVGGGPKITTIDLKVEADVPGIDEAKFREQAEHTKKTCLVSVVLAGAQINLDAKLVR